MYQYKSEDDLNTKDRETYEKIKKLQRAFFDEVVGDYCEYCESANKKVSKEGIQFLHRYTDFLKERFEHGICDFMVEAFEEYD